MLESIHGEKGYMQMIWRQSDTNSFKLLAFKTGKTNIPCTDFLHPNTLKPTLQVV